MSLHRGIDGPEPVRADPVGSEAGQLELRRRTSSTRLGTGTLACPVCDAPVAPPAGGLSPADPLGCGFCHHAARVRDFLSLAAPSRPARVVVRVAMGESGVVRSHPTRTRWKEGSWGSRASRW